MKIENNELRQRAGLQCLQAMTRTWLEWALLPWPVTTATISCPLPTRQLPATCSLRDRYLPITCPLPTCQLLLTYKLAARNLPATYLLRARYLPVSYLLRARLPPVTCPLPASLPAHQLPRYLLVSCPVTCMVWLWSENLDIKNVEMMVMRQLTTQCSSALHKHGQLQHQHCYCAWHQDCYYIAWHYHCDSHHYIACVVL